ncbi:hypothetical protein GCM10007160_04710 [Litchfieldella qijiaojingensis]|uniref:Uncharacterized protein n=1 Tax=Litchfieldella qijiaojingensis TaxID=980347 RepID=A0ABQ2YE92_9GAMM|nr:hypothetical protein GCM10007160_04710 [Halomonas qijiaojingensis]
MKNNSQAQVDCLVRREYSAPQLKFWGTVSDITQVGLTNPGGDVWPGKADHDPGSITHSNAGGN